MPIDYDAVPSPAFVLDLARLRRNLETIARIRDEAGVSIILALKGFAMWRVFPLINRYLDGATASSLHEARLIYEEMGEKAHTYAPAYLPGEWEEIARLSNHLTFNSLSQYGQYADRLPEGVSPGLRVNPEYSDVEVDLYNPASPHSRLGELAEDLEKSGLPEKIEGLHFHVL
ncbi:MAG: carboxynorspermidine decarboxylase, partial [Saprospiraceae bacterium]|nr:carboxynorspermidine decarboxylase [Saprospiraceae bacterium]